jgi:hypothetical protein
MAAHRSWGRAGKEKPWETTVTVPVHPAFAESLRAARAAGIIGEDVFAGKMVRGRMQPMNKKAWAAKFKKYAVLAGINEPKKSCHGVRKARAEAAYADCTESQMMAMFGWTDPKMPAHYIAQANREKLGMSGMDKVVAFDQSQSLDDFMPLAEENSGETREANKVVILRSKDVVNSGGCAWVWCARRATAFAAISIAYPSEPEKGSDQAQRCFSNFPRAHALDIASHKP